jgi:UDP-N-acetylmuramoylalanine--D-glutamate ligase
MKPVHEFNGRQITVMGLGRFGGGIGVTRFLAARGARVTVTDRADAQHLAESIEKIKPGIDSGAVILHLGDHRIEDFITADLVVASPAVPKPWMNEFLAAATAAGVPITSEIGLLVHHLRDRSRIVGVTGSAGKSTTAAMTAHAITAIVRQRGDRRACHLGGNIGGSLLDTIDSIAPEDLVVLELSSAMLHWLAGDRWSPGVAAVTNIAENHLDWHGDFEHYEKSKHAIIDHQLPGDTALLPKPLESWSDNARALVRCIDPSAPNDDLAGVRLLLPGAHNRDNAQLAAHTASTALGRSGTEASPNECARTLSSFKPLPHRLERIADADGRRAYNDSKSTTPDSARRAIEAILEDEGAPAIHLICGGSDKGADYAPLVEASKGCERVYTIGLTGPTIAAAMTRAGIRVAECGTLASAVEQSLASAGPGSVILLSPACASYDQFRSYDERGDAFTRLVRSGIANRPKTEKIGDYAPDTR